MLADIAVHRRMVAVGYVVITFIIIPLTGIAILG
jgi:hypothetical protein